MHLELAWRAISCAWVQSTIIAACGLCSSYLRIHSPAKERYVHMITLATRKGATSIIIRASYKLLLAAALLHDTINAYEVVIST